jgi:hypothetical protein
MSHVLTDVIQPILSALATALIPILVAALLDRVRLWTGIEIEARHREALQSALANAARVAIDKGDVQEGVDYVLRSVPDAIKALAVDGADHIEELLAPHIAKAKKG